MRRNPAVSHDATDHHAVPASPGPTAARGQLAATDVLREVLRSEATAASLRRQQVARARQRVSQIRLDDAQLLEGIASSLLAASTH